MSNEPTRAPPARCILIIEDDQQLRDSIGKVLRQHGYKTLEASSGEQGLELARADTPDLVLSDVRMGRIDGFGVLKCLRSQPHTSALPVILMTGTPEKGGMRHGMEHGADDYLVKPFQMTDLLAAVHARLERRECIQTQYQANEARLLEILSVTQDLVAIADADTGHLLHLNLAGRKMLGIGEKEDVRGLCLKDFHADTQSIEIQEERVLSAQRDGCWVGESAFSSRDGRRIPVSKQILTHRSLTEQRAYLSIVAREITERLAAEQALRESENRYRTLVDCQGEGVVIFDVDQRFTFANPAAEEVLGQSARELAACRLQDFLNEQDQALVTEQVKLRRTGKKSSYEIQLATPRGEHRQVLVTATPQFDAQSQFVGTFAVLRDITERKQAEETLRRQAAELSRERILLRTLIDYLPLCVYAKDKQGRKTISNPTDVRLLGRKTEAEVLGQTDYQLLPQGVASTCHADDMSVIQTGQPMLNREELIRNDEGQNVWLLTSKLPLRDEQGEVIGLVGTGLDITERRLAEEALREALAKFQDLIESMSDWVWETDAEGRFIYSSPKVRDVLGYTPEEILGLTLYDLVPSVETRHLKAALADGVRTRQRLLRLETHYLHKDGNLVLLETSLMPVCDPTGQPRGWRGVDRDITERRRAEEQLRKLSQAVEQSPASVMITDPNGRIEYVNPKFVESTGYQSAEVLGKNPRFLKSGLTEPALYHGLWQSLTNGREWQGELCNKKRNGVLFWEAITISPIKDDAGGLTAFVAIKRDVTEQKLAEKERSLMEVQLRQAQKLEAIGQLAAGIAHEINTPTQYVGDNTRFLHDSFQSLQQVCLAYAEILSAAKQHTLTTEVIAQAEAAIAQCDLEYLFEQIPAAINETLEGVGRITKIVRAMKEFSHPGGKDKCAADLNKAIETTVTVARNEWKYVAELKLDLDPELPAVPCFLGEFNQAILNLVINAAHAIGDVVKEHPGSKGQILIQTRRLGDQVEICVGDSGSGISEANRSRIFEPFFTTKEVGKGTGQGLSIVYGSITKKHGGSVTFESEVGRGTTFRVCLPIAPRAGGDREKSASCPNPPCGEPLVKP